MAFRYFKSIFDSRVGTIFFNFYLTRQLPALSLFYDMDPSAAFVFFWSSVYLYNSRGVSYPSSDALVRIHDQGITWIIIYVVFNLYLTFISFNLWNVHFGIFSGTYLMYVMSKKSMSQNFHLR